jgi:hypothetical protein
MHLPRSQGNCNQCHRWAAQGAKVSAATTTVSAIFVARFCAMNIWPRRQCKYSQGHRWGDQGAKISAATATIAAIFVAAFGTIRIWPRSQGKLSLYNNGWSFDICVFTKKLCRCQWGFGGPPRNIYNSVLWVKTPVKTLTTTYLYLSWF